MEIQILKDENIKIGAQERSNGRWENEDARKKKISVIKINEGTKSWYETNMATKYIIMN